VFGYFLFSLCEKRGNNFKLSERLQELDVVGYACNSRTQAGGSQIQGFPESHNKTLSQKTKIKRLIMVAQACNLSYLGGEN
jgi:hypothetical protein